MGKMTALLAYISKIRAIFLKIRQSHDTNARADTRT